MNTIDDCKIVVLDKHHSDRKGNLTVVGNGKDVNFDVKRVYYLYDVPGGESRGGHAHRQLYQLVVAASGSFSVTLDDGKAKKTIYLNQPNQGLLIVPGIWRTLEDFSSGAVCLVLASELYSESDYIRDYNDFLLYRLTKLPDNFSLDRYGLHVRFVDENDADFIMKIRTNQRNARYIHSTDNDLEKQREYLKNYKSKESRGEEYYLIFEKDGVKQGVLRLYNRKEGNIVIGSWVFDSAADKKSAPLAYLITCEIAFENLEYQKIVDTDGTHQDNKSVWNFHKMMGAEFLRKRYEDDDVFIVWQLEKDVFENRKKEILHILV